MLKVNEEIEKAGNGVMITILNTNEGDDINASIRRIGDELSWLGDGDLCDKEQGGR